MSTAICLAAASIADASALSAAGKRLFEQAYGKYSRADDLAIHVEEYFGHDSIARELACPDVSYTVAFDAGTIAGFIKTRCGPAPDPVPAGDALEVQQLYVDASAQRKGIGRKLMDRAIAAARDGGRAGIWLSVWQDADWALRFYEAYGFRRIGTAEFWLGRSRFMDYLMWLAVDDFPGVGRT
jgi:ribosomal protein S18 acetylase RimI-like enzyme